MNKLPFFQKGSPGDFSFRERTGPSNYGKALVFFGLLIFLFSVLSLRLFQLTIVKGDYYRRLSESNRIRQLLIEPRRGTIVDRKGLVLAENSPADTKKNGERLFSRRTYHSPTATGAILGYRQLADEHDLAADNCLPKLHLGDKTGKKGVEKLFECDLRGVPGKKLIEVDARGQYLRTLTVQPPNDGQTLTLALDLELQQKAAELVRGQRAAIVVLKPQTGEVLALVSTPAFNPQDFEDNNALPIAAYLTQADQPLFNRTLEGVYPPGSIFKLIVGTAALEEKKIDEHTLFEDTGTIKAGPLSFGNWYFLQYGKTDGQVDIVKGIRRSNDIFFYKTAETVGPDKIKIWAENFGFGKKTGSGLAEADGLIPSPFWKKETLKEDWYLGDTYNYSIGQGYVLVTPIQIAQATAALGNGGRLCRPQLLKIANDNAHCEKINLHPTTLSLVREGMRQACSAGGTGWPLFDFQVKGQPIQTACKTGTAESRDKSTAPHAWFTAFAPFENPEIVVTVLVEEAGQGSDIGGPIVKEILKEYFER
ncbi:hypothetical protein HY214_03865 [Candidatus Roizmanbacteria bacterium]|nr:hypothetical protein [Candidatus Roizmanbacteria bacterium]